jgi:hypothetical protein
MNPWLECARFRELLEADLLQRAWMVFALISSSAQAEA